MARTKKINENMGPLIDALAEFRTAEATIRAKYALLAEQEIGRKRAKVMDLMFITHHDSGPSEIANTTGLSRTTVIRWRKEFLEREAAKAEEWVDPDAEIIEELDKEYASEADEHDHEFVFSMERSTESNADFHRIANLTEGDVIYVIFGNMYGRGDTANDADYNQVDRPAWLSDDVLRAAEAETGIQIPGTSSHRA
jgi:hypothetical protein